MGNYHIVFAFGLLTGAMLSALAQWLYELWKAKAADKGKEENNE